ncbi:unnamed protein product [Candida verbasci]|uniref:Cyclin N-terminal domain-containing protein n=1 Tax=Candida verbasci TaxID=1227364 RepID=A0A9W4X8X9_9ASCO|nr:unnamed protein product [Candida verbasci]
MPQISTNNNDENEYKLIRSKVLQQQQSSTSIINTTTTTTTTNISTTNQNSQDENYQQQPIDQQISSSTDSTEHLQQAQLQSEVQLQQRQYLGDVSNQFITSNNSTSQKNQQPPQQQQPASKKRKPFGGDIAPLHQHRKQQQIPIATDNNEQPQHQQQPKLEKGFEISNSSLLVPSRLPQKRQATESSTNLVEKLKIPENNNQFLTNQNKKSKLIDYEWQDLDEEDIDDPLMASEYVNDIFTYFYELESRMLPDSQYLYKQKHLKPKMRSILVDWLVEMHLKFKLLPESLFLAINIMDRFMSIEDVQVDKLQLLATASLFIAAKYEEVFSPSVKNYAYFTDGGFTEEEILQAEKYVLTILNFDLNYPNPMNFLRRISKADDYDVQTRTLGKYLLEITIIDYKFIGMKPSLCCASAMYLSRLMMGRIPIWNGNLIHYSGGYRIQDMQPCIQLMFSYLIAPIEHDEFFKKYAMRKFMKASTYCRAWAKKFHSEGKDLFDESLSTHRLQIEE